MAIFLRKLSPEESASLFGIRGSIHVALLVSALSAYSAGDVLGMQPLEGVEPRGSRMLLGKAAKMLGFSLKFSRISHSTSEIIFQLRALPGTRKKLTPVQVTTPISPVIIDGSRWRPGEQRRRRRSRKVAVSPASR